MEIKPQEITIRQLVENYEDNGEEGVTGYGNKLDIRPPFQREFVYNDKQREAVIDTITKKFPLNVMYWSERNDGTYEIIDGQQRTISIAQYVEGDFSYNDLYYENLTDDKQEQIMNYKLMVYLCNGTDSEKLDWFRTINIAGEELNPQELRNAVYSGPWVSDAKRHFSKRDCPAYQVGSDYLKGTPIRQDYLETVIKWISNDNVEDYMGKHQKESDAKDLWKYFLSVVDWIEATFKVKRTKLMKGLDWGSFYANHKDDVFNADRIESKIQKLLEDRDVEKKSGIYPYILTGKEKYLNIRKFDDDMKMLTYARQSGICAACGAKFDIADMEADHVTPWAEGGKTNEENCQMLCREDNRRKGAR